MSDIAAAPLALHIFSRATPVVPSDTTIVGFMSLYIGVAGDVVVVPSGQTDTVTFKACPVGILPVSVSKVLAATAATNILGLRFQPS